MKTVCGIDPSLTGTGICWGETSDDWKTERVTSKKLGTQVADRLRRYEGILRQLEPILTEAQPGVIMIEGYSYGSKSSGMTQAMITEFGSLLRWHLVDHAPHLIEVAPSTLKKFATGKGNAKKEQVIGHVQKTWNVLFDSSDECDAFALYQMGLAIAERTEVNQTQRDAVCKALENHHASAAAIRDVCDGVKPPF